jgi:hypothetical protein
MSASLTDLVNKCTESEEQYKNMSDGIANFISD